MIPPQLIMFAAKHSKKLIYFAIFMAVLFSIWLAFQYHENVVDQNGQLRGQLASTELARRVDAAKIDIQKTAIEQWQESHAQLQATLLRQEQASVQARTEKRELNEIFRDHDLSRLAAAKPGLIERRINSGTARIHRLLVCASASARCDNDGHPVASDETESPQASAAGAGTLQMARSGSGIFSGSRRGVLLCGSAGLRSRSPQSGRNPALHSRDHVAIGLLSERCG